MEEPHVIYGVHVTNRATQIPDVQKLLSEFGCNIKTRIGLHHVDEKVCSPRGLILLEMFGDMTICRELKIRLANMEGVDVQEMIFDHD